jgi:flagellar export protein FliJ
MCPAGSLAAIGCVKRGERMTLSRQFVQRYTKIQQGLQEQAELALAKAVQSRSEAEHQLRAVSDTVTEAQVQRDQCSTAADIQQWYQYLQALEMRVQTSRTMVVDAKAAETAKRDEVGVAYREARRWEMMSNKVQQAFAESSRKAGQQEADAFASQRFGRGEGE